MAVRVTEKKYVGISQKKKKIMIYEIRYYNY